MSKINAGRAARPIVRANTPPRLAEVERGIHVAEIEKTPRRASRIRDAAGQTLVEYALILFLVSVTAVLALQAIGVNIAGLLSSLPGQL